MLPQSVLERIENEAKEFLLSEHFKPQYIWTNDIRNTYIACAKKYEEKQQVLVEALEAWQSFDARIHTSVDAAKFHMKGRKALEQFKTQSV